MFCILQKFLVQCVLVDTYFILGGAGIQLEENNEHIHENTFLHPLMLKCFIDVFKYLAVLLP